MASVEQETGRRLRQYRYVNRSFDRVCDALAAAPEEILAAGRAGEHTIGVRRAGIEISRPVRVTLGAFERSPGGARLVLRWEAVRHPSLYPVLDGILELAPLPSGRRHVTQVGLIGHYVAPFGALGTAVDSLAGADIARDAIARFLDDVCAALERATPPESPDPEVHDLRPAERFEPSRIRRILVSVPGLQRRPGGAAALQQRLAETPGVVRSVIDPQTAMAEIEYDSTICYSGELVAQIEDDAALA